MVLRATVKVVDWYNVMVTYQLWLSLNDINVK